MCHLARKTNTKLQLHYSALKREITPIKNIVARADRSLYTHYLPKVKLSHSSLLRVRVYIYIEINKHRTVAAPQANFIGRVYPENSSSPVHVILHFPHVARAYIIYKRKKKLEGHGKKRDMTVTKTRGEDVSLSGIFQKPVT